MLWRIRELEPLERDAWRELLEHIDDCGPCLRGRCAAAWELRRLHLVLVSRLEAVRRLRARRLWPRSRFVSSSPAPAFQRDDVDVWLDELEALASDRAYWLRKRRSRRFDRGGRTMI